MKKFVKSEFSIYAPDQAQLTVFKGSLDGGREKTEVGGK